MMPSPFAPLSFKALVYNNRRNHKKRTSKKASSGQATTLEKLPGELKSEIFTRLLARQLAQMRSVSKSWNAFLSDSDFIKAHLTRSLEKNDEVLLFSGFLFSFGLGPSPFRARLSRSPEVEFTDFIKLPVIPQSDFGFGHVIGSVNGLICFCYLSSPNEYVLHIWNASLSALLSLPPCPFSSCGRVELGFGYDSVSEDYKIVRLTPNMEPPQCEVYSMRKGSWKVISDQTFPLRVKVSRGFNNQVYANGHVYWICDSDLEGNPQVILTFDLGVETFSQIPLPDVVHKCSNHLGVMDGELCVMSKDGDSGAWDMWVMSEYGVADSWVKHHMFDQISGDATPYGFTSHGEFLIQAGQEDRHSLYELRFGLYDPIAAKVNDFKIMLDSNFSKVVEYVDSLVWVTPPTRRS